MEHVMELAAAMKAIAIFLFWLVAAMVLTTILVTWLRTTYTEWMK